MSVLAYPTDRPAYSRLCRLLMLGKGKCLIHWDDLMAYGEGLITIFLPEVADDECGLQLRRLREASGDRALFHEPSRRILQDVVAAIRHNVTVDELGYRREHHPVSGDAR